jgi:hypothetical protein
MNPPCGKVEKGKLKKGSHYERGMMICKEGIRIDVVEIRDITGLKDP